MALLLTVGTCVMILAAAIACLKPVMEFIASLERIIGLDNSLIATLLKILGIGLLSEISAMICADAGRGSLGKALQILGSGVILVLSVPIFQLLLSLVGDVLGGV